MKFQQSTTYIYKYATLLFNRFYQNLLIKGSDTHKKMAIFKKLDVKILSKSISKCIAITKVALFEFLNKGPL